MIIDDMTMDDPALDRALRELDAADAHLGARARAHQRELLETIVSCGGEPACGQGSRVVPPRTGWHRPAVRWLLPAAAASALAGAVVLGGGGKDHPAYASWTAEPAPVTGEQLAQAERSCRAGIADSLAREREGTPESIRSVVTPESMRLVIAERRGEYVFTGMAAPDGSMSECFFDAGLSRVSGMTGSWATKDSPPPARLAGGQIEAGGPGMTSGPEGSYAFIQGRVGAGVAKVTLRTGGRTVSATVSNGHFGAWWPIAQPEKVAGPGPDVAYDLTLRDGTVLRDQKPLGP